MPCIKRRIIYDNQEATINILLPFPEFGDFTFGVVDGVFADGKHLTETQCCAIANVLPNYISKDENAKIWAYHRKHMEPIYAEMNKKFEENKRNKTGIFTIREENSSDEYRPLNQKKCKSCGIITMTKDKDDI